MKMKSRYVMIVALSLTMCLPAIAQTASSGAPMSSDQIKKQAQAQKKAGEAKDKLVKAQDANSISTTSIWWFQASIRRGS